MYEELSFLAAVLVEQNAPLELLRLHLPKTLAPGQVVVDFKAASICGAQINEISGAKGPDRFLPHLLGHEGAGIVSAIGPGVQTVQPGDRVVAHWRKGPGIETAPPRYLSDKGKEVGGGWITTFNERAIISENRLTLIPPDIPWNVAALMGCAVTTGAGLITHEADLKLGESVMVLGVGGVGMSVVMAAKAAGAGRIVAFDKSDPKLRLAADLGADECANTSIDSQWNWNGRKFDVVVECTGVPEMIDFGLIHTAPNGGRLILVGQPRIGNHVLFSDFRQHYFGKTIKDSLGGSTIPDRDIPRYINLWRNRRLAAEQLITHSIPLEEINSGIDKVRKGEVTGRCVITMG